MKILFIPVSSEKGIGEYMRSRVIADELVSEICDIEVAFVLNQKAPYAPNCPYKTYFTPESPTKCNSEVFSAIDSFQPNIVVFDASGRTAQFAYAKSKNAYTIFISQHRKKRSKALRISRLRVTDKHLVAQPDFTIEKLSLFEKIKLTLVRKEPPINAGVFFQEPSPTTIKSTLKKYALKRGEYLFINAGSGGHTTKEGRLAADIFFEGSKDIDIPKVQIWGANYPSNIPETNEKNIHLKSISNKEFISLLASSKAALINGGDTLLQAMSLKVPVLASPVSSDQPQRIKKALSTESIRSSTLDKNEIKLKLEDLISKPSLININERLSKIDIKNANKIFKEIIKKEMSKIKK